ncbi:uncharacterized protein I303_106428 [Kwoniella dejecticola CBS 10117]|uniref:DUF1996 domain-containing protein n=1 Tax=Kwoniella dejecticola CBS 10117 TaxID=1296121 RepID=A0A1A5ZUR3_9TREE|nr:uncharacterized protein I303_08313 [Kwoniella dejecticola CBS 10117]OBR81543.1 hypothetical protein I303_08313 [Kwoniella dejecticola CBS 10117]
MMFSSTITTLLATSTIMSSLALGAADHWIITQLQTLTISRMDPIVNPNDVSAHAHRIVGASNFNWHLNSPNDQLNAACSSTIIGDDKSNYWAPQLYYRHPNNTFTPILGGVRVYYFNKNKDVKPFPPGLNMITGTAMARGAGTYKGLGVKISCDHGLQTPYLPNGTSHPGGCGQIALGIYFPSCGLANGAISSSDHFSHMAWPQSYKGPNLVDDPNGIVCPASHPIKYPTIFAEFNYYLDAKHPWRNDECTFVLSNGDCLGDTFHADFVNGWVPQTLKDAIGQCGFGKGVGDNLDACAPLKKTKSEPKSWDCRLDGQIPDEEVGLWRPIKSLPGCNPLWKASQTTKPGCSSTPAKPGYVNPNAYFENLKFRNKIPVALAELKDDADITKYIPSVGDTGAGRLGWWGTEGSNKNQLEKGSWQSIINSLASGTKPPAIGNMYTNPDHADSASDQSAGDQNDDTAAQDQQEDGEETENREGSTPPVDAPVLAAEPQESSNTTDPTTPSESETGETSSGAKYCK